MRVSVSLTGVSPFLERRYVRFGPFPEIDPEIANVSVVSPDASISGYERVGLAIADGNVMFLFGVGNGTVFEICGWVIRVECIWLGP